MKGLAELPTRGCHVVACEGPSVTGGDLEGEGLAVEVRVALPVLAPIPGHGSPVCSGPFDRDRMDVPCTAHVGHQNQVEVRVTVYAEPYSSFLHTRHSVHKTKQN